MAFTLYALLMGNAMVIQWSTEPSLEIVKVVLDRFTKNLFDFTIPADSYLLTDTFKASGIQIKSWTYSVYFSLFTFGLLLFLTSISDLSRTFYYVGIASFVIILGSLGIESLGVFKQIHDKAFLVITILAYAPLSFYFHSFRRGTHYLTRFGIYLGITIALYIIAYTQGQVEDPAMYLSNQGIAGPIIFVLSFSIINGHEIIRGILYLITYANHEESKGSSLHFLILCVIYFLNLAYTYIHFTMGIDWGIYYLHPFALLVLTALIGLWGWRLRELQYKGVMDFAPTGAFLYLSMATVSFSIIALALATANDPLIEVFEDVILYSHIGFGLMFVIYTILNYIDYLENHKVHKVVYEPQKVDFWAAWLIGLIIAGALVAKSGMLQYKQAKSAYFIGLGDISRVENDLHTSGQYYNLAQGYDRLSHRPFYSLGELARVQGNNDAAYVFFKSALQKKPSPYAYANMADLMFKNKQFFEAIFDLREGIEVFPKSGELYNNLALLYNQTQIADSVFYFFDKGREYSQFPDIVESNLFALLTKYDYFQEVDIDIASISNDYIGNISNQLTYRNKFEEVDKKPLKKAFLQDSILYTPNLCYLYNFTINHRKEAPDSLPKWLNDFAYQPENAHFREYLLLGKSIVHYSQGELLTAVELLKEIYGTAYSINSYYPNLLGLWLIRQGEFNQAAYYFRQAYQRGNQGALISMAIAQSELEDKEEALESWGRLATSEATDIKAMADDMLRLLSPDSLKKMDFTSQEVTDLNKYRFLHYHQAKVPTRIFDEICETIRDSQYKVVAIVERAQWYLDRSLLEEAGQLIAQLEGEVVEERIQPLVTHVQLRLAHMQGKISEEFLQKVESAQYAAQELGLKSYYQAAYYQHKGDTAQAEQAYKNAIRQLPFKEDIYLDFAKFYTSEQREDEAYEVLLNATMLNERSTKLLKAYVLKCLELYFDSYAETGLEDLERLLTRTQYQEFMKVYNAKKSEMEKRFEDWEADS
ncbi:tetratricopeptide repeat protein [Rapidithrix thailandica]|uniref:Tetratricopeptide repeat protein n=1 Tax=Rapidithrix thailandica TaxID=413964 RepID=A0AAW9S1V1_9BACT